MKKQDDNLPLKKRRADRKRTEQLFNGYFASAVTARLDDYIMSLIYMLDVDFTGLYDVEDYKPGKGRIFFEPIKINRFIRDLLKELDGKVRVRIAFRTSADNSAFYLHFFFPQGYISEDWIRDHYPEGMLAGAHLYFDEEGLRIRFWIQNEMPVSVYASDDAVAPIYTLLYAIFHDGEYRECSFAEISAYCVSRHSSGREKAELPS